MKTFVDCEICKMGGLFGKKNLWVSPSLGDWLAMGRDVKYISVAYDGQLLHISTPADTQIILSDGTVHEVGAGTYDFPVKEQ
jgi:hypothetical protein